MSYCPAKDTVEQSIKRGNEKKKFWNKQGKKIGNIISKGKLDMRKPTEEEMLKEGFVKEGEGRYRKTY